MWKIISGHSSDRESRFYNEMTRAQRAASWVTGGYISVGFDGGEVEEASSLKSFVHHMKPGDLVVFRTEGTRTAVGEIRIGRIGHYYRSTTDHPHRRRVEWLATLVRDKHDVDMERATHLLRTLSPIKDKGQKDGVNLYAIATDRFGLHDRYTVARRPLGQRAEHVKADYLLTSRPVVAGPFEATVAATNLHNETQNVLLDWLRRQFGQEAVQTCDLALGWKAQVDLLLEQDERITVIEVKSIQNGNDVDQLRYGLTQTLDYMDRYSFDGRDVHGALWLSSIPEDAERWRQLCDRHGVRLGWPGEERAVFRC